MGVTGPGSGFSAPAVAAARSIANYCTTRFPCDTPPCEMLDVPWFAEKIQDAIDAEVARLLQREREEVASKVSDIARRVGVAASPAWIREQLEKLSDQYSFWSGRRKAEAR